MKYLKLFKKQDYVIVQLMRGKANVLNGPMVKEIVETFQTLQEDDSVRGVILAGQANFFSAGLDLIELYDYDQEQMRTFFIDFGTMHILMARFPKPFICAITGYAPAGGCVMAVASDYRIMADNPKYTIGLNEVAVNIQITNNLIEAYSFWLGKGKAAEFDLEGKLLNPQEAFAAGLVSELAPLEDVLGRAEEKMQHYLQADPNIFRLTKYKLRQSWLEKINDSATEELEMSESIWWKPAIRTRMKMFVDLLLMKKNAKKS